MISVRCAHLALSLAIGVAATSARAAALGSTHDEATFGDFSSNAATPTALAFGLGSNAVVGMVANSGGAGGDRDYFTFTIGPNHALTALNLTAYSPGNISFLAVNAGATGHEPSAASDPLYLAGIHVWGPDVGANLLVKLDTGAVTVNSLPAPMLGPGVYTFVSQQLSAFVTSYAFEFVVSPSPTGTPYCFGDGSGSACPCSPAPVPHGVPGNGCANNLYPGGANASATGTASVSADTLVLSASGMNNGAMIFYQGPTAESGGAGSAFGDGLRCIQPTGVRRFKTKNVVGNASSYPEPGDVKISTAGAIRPGGGTFHYQGWYRSANPAFCTAATFNLTNGVAVVWAP